MYRSGPESRTHGTASPTHRLTHRERAAMLATRKPRVLLDDFEGLLDSFADHVLAARKLKVTDPKHDALVRVALRGFSLTSKIFKWDAPHFAYIKRRAKQHYEAMGDGPLLFFCLAAGYALGLGEEDQLTKHEFKVAQDHLDGVIRLNLLKIKAGFEEAMRVRAN